MNFKGNNLLQKRIFFSVGKVKVYQISHVFSQGLAPSQNLLAGMGRRLETAVVPPVDLGLSKVIAP